MSTLAGTTWTFSTSGNLAGTISFQQVGPSSNAGVATITATNPPVGYMGSTTFTAQWAEVGDGNQFAVQLASFIATDGFNPPPLGIPTINASGSGSAQPVTLWGSHTNGNATMYGSNFQTMMGQDVVAAFSMTRNP